MSFFKLFYECTYDLTSSRGLGELLIVYVSCLQCCLSHRVGVGDPGTNPGAVLPNYSVCMSAMSMAFGF